MIRLLTILCVLVLGVVALPNTGTGQVPDGTAIARPIDAAAWALADSEARGDVDERYIRYVWIPAWMNAKDAARVNSFAVNTAVSQSALISTPKMVANMSLVRWDLRLLANNQKDLANIVAVWESMAGLNPYFNINDHGTTKFAYHAGPAVLRLARRLHTNAPIVRADWFLTKILTVNDNGLYYKFQFPDILKPANRANSTAQDLWMRQLGVDEKTVQRTNGDQRAATIHSGVTAKPRRTDFLHGSLGLMSVTFDVSDNAAGAAQDPIRNLLNFKDDAREAIAEKANGLHSFALFDGKGNLQNSAPEDAVVDHRIPAPFTKRLEAPISCIRCHAGAEGWQPVVNDINKLVSAQGLNVFGDLSGGNDQEAVVARLASLYSGSFEKTLRRAREDYSEATVKATAGYDAKKTAILTGEQFEAYRYNLVSPADAVAELGILLENPKDGTAAIRWLVQTLGTDRSGISPEDPIIGALKAGLSINRKDWEKVYADAADRATIPIREFIHAKN